MKYIYAIVYTSIAYMISMSVSYALVIPTGLVVSQTGVQENVFVTLDGDDPWLTNTVTLLNSNNNTIAYFAYGVGIGVSAPVQLLHVHTNALVTGNVSIWTGTISDRMRINGNAQVQGNVLSPSLSVYTQNTPIAILTIADWVYYQSLNSSIDHLMQSDALTGWIEDTFMDVFRPLWHTGSTTGTIVTHMLGIWTANPQASLHVVGDVRIDAPHIGNIPTDGNGDCRILTLDSNNHVVLWILPWCTP